MDSAERRAERAFWDSLRVPQAERLDELEPWMRKSGIYVRALFHERLVDLGRVLRVEPPISWLFRATEWLNDKLERCKR